ncbi:LRP3_10_12 [Mytilus edulis]|uniref:LRP3_10_12 n=1 Tax=Mytilus edulis TaxID=6550 RepID=A0A8S3U7U0_MYTED|nr:LRP3_10_12 [Mytilus edulis]
MNFPKCIGILTNRKNASATLIKETCCGLGDTVPFPVYSTNGYMYILFQTDETVGREGFRISYILEGAPTTTARITTNEPTLEGAPTTTARITTNEHKLEGTSTTTAWVTTNTNLDHVDSKLPVYIAVGCAAAAMIIIFVVCYIIRKKFSNNKIKINGCNNDSIKT